MTLPEHNLFYSIKKGFLLDILAIMQFYKMDEAELLFFQNILNLSLIMTQACL